MRLNWTTDSEIENQGFIIERTLRTSTPLSVTAQGSNSEFIEEWSEIASYLTHAALIGHGSTSTQHDYIYIDKQVKVGETYSYILSDVDYKGNVTRHAEIIMSINNTVQNQGFSITTYPNPSNSGIRLAIRSEEEPQPLKIDILNLRGERVKHLFSATSETNILNVRWDGTDSELMPVSSGTYIVNISGPSISHSKAITIIQ